MRRIYHHWERWECVPAGMYNPALPAGMIEAEAKQSYCEFLSNLELFESSMYRVFYEWPISCEHFLTNGAINRIAWMGQAAMCIHSGVPCFYRAGFCLLSAEQQREANECAKQMIVLWADKNQSKLDFAPEITSKVAPRGMIARIRHYIECWEARGYEAGLPDDIPCGLYREKLAPSYKAIAMNILKNDVNCLSLGYAAPKYSVYDMFYGQRSQTVSDINQMELNI